MHKETITDWNNISTEVLQESALGPVLYFFYTVDILANNYSMTATFTDDMAIMTTDKDQQTTTDWL